MDYYHSSFIHSTLTKIAFYIHNHTLYSRNWH